METLDIIEVIDETIDKKIEKPAMYNIVIYDDDVTTMAFVCEILETYFNCSSEEAYDLMMDIHIIGNVKIGLYTKDIAESKLSLVKALLKSTNFPLKLNIIKS